MQPEEILAQKGNFWALASSAATQTEGGSVWELWTSCTDPRPRWSESGLGKVSVLPCSPCLSRLSFPGEASSLHSHCLTCQVTCHLLTWGTWDSAVKKCRRTQRVVPGAQLAFLCVVGWRGLCVEGSQLASEEAWTVVASGLGDSMVACRAAGTGAGPVSRDLPLLLRCSPCSDI